MKTTKDLADRYIEQWYSERPEVIGYIKEQEEYQQKELN